MVKSFVSAAPQLGMLAPPPLLWLSHLPAPSVSRSRDHHKTLFGTPAPLHANDRFFITGKVMTSLSRKVPVAVVALDEKSSVGDDEESLSDASSYRDPRTVTRYRAATKRVSGTMTSVKLTVPPGKPLSPKPRLVGADFLKTHKCTVRKSSKAAVPLKKVVSKARMVKRSSLSQDEKLFVEAAATLVQSGACK